MLVKGVKSLQLQGATKQHGHLTRLGFPQTTCPQNKTLNSACKTLAQFVLDDPNSSFSMMRSPLAGDNEAVTRQIGSTLNNIGGISLMIQIATEVVPPCARRELEVVWHGIGEWKA